MKFLSNLFKSKPIKNPAPVTSSKQDDDDIDFLMKYGNEIHKLEGIMIESYIAASDEKSFAKKKKKYEKAIMNINVVKKFCYSLGAAGERYYDEMWGSKGQSVKYLERAEDEYNEVITNKEKYIQEELLDKKIALFEKTSKKIIMDIIIKNPGIVQTDIYLKFDSIYQNSIRFTIYTFAKNNEIRREKYKNTYKLFK